MKTSQGSIATPKQRKVRGVEAALVRDGAVPVRKKTDTTDFVDITVDARQARHDKKTGTVVFRVQTVGPTAKERHRRRGHVRAVTPHWRGRGPTGHPRGRRTGASSASSSADPGDPDPEPPAPTDAHLLGRGGVA